MNKPSPIKLTWILLGWINFILGVIGVFLPLVPTTPFLLLSAFCFSKGSPRLHSWLLSRPYLGQYIREWNESGSIPLSAKISCMILLALSFIFLMTLERVPDVGKISIGVLFTCVSIFVLSRPSRK